MTIETKWDTIETPYTVATAPIQADEGEGRKLLANVNALDEALANRACPGSSAQTFFGHDHALEGGIPLIRGMSFCADGGQEPIIVFASAGSTSEWPQGAAFGLSNASPGLNPDGRQLYRVDIKYKAIQSDFKIRFNAGDEVNVEQFDEGDAPRWVACFGSIPSDDWLTEANGIKVSAVTPFAKSNPLGHTNDVELQIYSIVMTETYEQSQYHGGGKIDLKSEPGSYTVYSHPNEKLASELVGDDDSQDALTRANTVMRVNALYEHTMDRKALGASVQTLEGHDHDPAGYGGRAVAMGCIYRCKNWRLATAYYLWTITCTVQNVWYYMDQAYAGRQRRTTAGSTPSGTVTTHPMILATVSPGFTSTGNPPTTVPFLIGVVELRHVAVPTATIEIVWYNLTTGTSSPVTAGSGTVSDETIVSTHVPCSGGVTNKFAIEVRCTSHAGLVVDVIGMALFEAGQYQGSNSTYVASTGSAPLAVAAEFRKA